MAERRNAIGPEPVVEIGGRPMLWHILKIYSEHGISDSSSDADTGRRHGRHGKVVSKALSLRTQFAHSMVLDFFSDEALVRLIGKTTARQIFASC